MEGIKTYRDLYAWQAGMDTVSLVYEITADFPAEERYGLVSQTSTASRSSSTVCGARNFRRLKVRPLVRPRFYSQPFSRSCCDDNRGEGRLPRPASRLPPPASRLPPPASHLPPPTSHQRQDPLQCRGGAADGQVADVEMPDA